MYMASNHYYIQYPTSAHEEFHYSPAVVKCVLWNVGILKSSYLMKKNNQYVDRIWQPILSSDQNTCICQPFDFFSIQFRWN